jgi:alpha-N-arabinofuranosidase
MHHPDPKAVNTEDAPDTVAPRASKEYEMDGDTLSIRMPALSWNVIRLAKD